MLGRGAIERMLLHDVTSHSFFRTLQNVTAGANPISIKRGIDKTCEYLVRLPAGWLLSSLQLSCVRPH